MSNIVKKTLPNGVRVLVEPVTSVQSAAIGLWCRTGSSHEEDQEAGITHLIEHMLFKGTARRPTAQEISEAIGQHRETGRGTGFPKKMLAEDISPMGKLMIVTYRFHELTSLQEGRASATPSQAMSLLKEIAISGSGDLDLLTATTLAKKFKG